MALAVEIIDFTRPVANCKNLYVTNIKTNEMTEAQIMTALLDACSPFGLLYEVQVFPCKSQVFGSSARRADSLAAYYAFVKFYSYRSAQEARRSLNNNLRLGTSFCKVNNAKRCKETDEGQLLYMSHCRELANHYLGFNGWTSSVRCLEQDQDTPDEVSEGPRVRFFCVVDVTFPHQGLSTHGIGAWEEMYCLRDATSKATAIHKTRKRSYQRALEHAFSRVLLVVVRGRDEKVKVTVEIDTTKPDELTEIMRDRVAQEQVLTVNEVTQAPAEDDREDEESNDKREDKDLDDDDNSSSALPDNIDDANLHILQQLGGEGGT